jgi:hypothetical protein
MIAITGRPTGLPALLDVSSRDRFRRLALLAVALTAALAYANALSNGFVLDDGAVIRTNPLVTSPLGAWRAFSLPYWPERIGGGQYRPLGIISFAFDWLVSGGNPRWFHAVNVLWHVAATVAVFTLAAELLAPAAALVAGLVFALHPVHVESVANVVGRLECMAAVFVIGALLAHRRRHWSAPVWFALGLLSKESAVVLIALAAANDVLLSRDWRATLEARRRWYASYAAVALLFAAAFLVVFHDRVATYPARGFVGTTTLERLAIVAKIIPHYVRLLLVPAELSASYGPNVIPADTSPSASTVLGAAAFVMLATAFFSVARERRWPVMAFALAWIPIALSPVSNVLFPSVWLAERTLYLPSIGVCLAAGALAERFFLTRPAAVVVVTGLVLIAFAERTWTRTPVWRDDRTFLMTLLTEHPESYEAHFAAARVLDGAGQYDAAEREFAVARRLFPRDSMVYREAADLARRRQRPALAAALLDSARIAPTLSLARP